MLPVKSDAVEDGLPFQTMAVVLLVYLPERHFSEILKGFLSRAVRCALDLHQNIRPVAMQPFHPYIVTPVP